MQPYVVVDVETSGLDPVRHELIEVGYVLVDEDGGWREVAFSMPFDEERASPKALEVNGWGTREFAPQISQADGAARIVEDFNSRFIVASPAHFDLGFIGAHLSRNDKEPSWSHRAVIDLKSVAIGKLGLLAKIGNGELANYLQVSSNPDKHTALADARWTHEMFKAFNLWGTK